MNLDKGLEQIKHQQEVLNGIITYIHEKRKTGNMSAVVFANMHWKAWEIRHIAEAESEKPTKPTERKAREHLLNLSRECTILLKRELLN